MINILPITERARLRKVYMVRVAALVFFMLSLVALVALALIVPAFFITNLNRASIADRLKVINASELNTKAESLNTVVSEINKRLIAFSDPATKILISKDVFSPIFKLTNNNLLLDHISTTTTPEGILQVSIGGTAKTRDALLSFERSLRTTPRFSGVDVPISNFVRGSDILFTMQFNYQ